MMKNILIAYHMLESSSGTYLEWLSNELDVTTKKFEHKDALLVSLSAKTKLNS